MAIGVIDLDAAVHVVGFAVFGFVVFAVVAADTRSVGLLLIMRFVVFGCCRRERYRFQKRHIIGCLLLFHAVALVTLVVIVAAVLVAIRLFGEQCEVHDHVYGNTQAAAAFAVMKGGEHRRVVCDIVLSFVVEFVRVSL